jgi:D-glycero-D-manno-heptose 1,7-bisphosphate phosphatase
VGVHQIKLNKAVFLDRDGVINEMVFRKDRNEYEPPHSIDELKLFSSTIESLKLLQDNSFFLFLVSNQPDYAKGKCTLEDLYAVHKKLDEIFSENKIIFKEYYYCYHHPNGVVKEYSYECECRKPKPYFVKKAVTEYNINVEASWLVGDRDTDIICGHTVGLKSILIENDNSKEYQGKSKPDLIFKNLYEATKNIIKKEIKK